MLVLDFGSIGSFLLDHAAKHNLLGDIVFICAMLTNIAPAMVMQEN